MALTTNRKANMSKLNRKKLYFETLETEAKYTRFLTKT